MKKALLPLFAVVLMMAFVACTDRNSTSALPRPTAWPRAVIYDTVYATRNIAPICFDANTAAVFTPKNGETAGADIAYPAYNAVIYLTVITNLKTEDEFLKVWNGRRKRIDLNTGGAPTDVSRVPNNNGWQCALVQMHTASQTPVQLLAGNTQTGTVVSATAFFNTPVTAANLDSILPTMRAVSIDMQRLAASLNEP